jgi:hypothetical protein
MPWLSAFVELVKALAWPTTVLVIIFLFRHAIKNLILSIREGKFKYGNVELSVKRDIKEARQSLEAHQSPETIQFWQFRHAHRLPEDRELSDLMSLAEIAPRAAMIEAWTRLEAAAATFIQSRPPSDLPPQSRPPVQLLLKHNLLPSEIIRAIQKLRDARNRTVHSPEFQPSVADAEEYVLLTNAVIADLHRIGNRTDG